MKLTPRELINHHQKYGKCSILDVQSWWCMAAARDLCYVNQDLDFVCPYAQIFDELIFSRHNILGHGKICIKTSFFYKKN